MLGQENVEKIKDNCGSLIAIKINDFAILKNSEFITDDDSFLQVGAFKYNQPHKVKKHKHNEILRKVDRTQEFIFILSGAMEANLFDDEDNFLTTLLLKPGSGLLILKGWHDFKIVDNCNFFEVKVGPYLGLDDKTIKD